MDSSIEKDLHRTLPNHPWLSSLTGQESLKKLLNVLAKKYSVQGY